MKYFSCKHTVAIPSLTLVLAPQHIKKLPSYSLSVFLSHLFLYNFLSHSCLPREQPVSGWINCLERKELPFQRKLDYTTQHPVQKKKKKRQRVADGRQEWRKRKRDRVGWWGMREGGRRVGQRRGKEGDCVTQNDIQSQRLEWKKEDGVERCYILNINESLPD